MSRTVLDVTRLLTRASHPVATGVDRVELAYARRALAQPPGRIGFAAIVGKRAAPLDPGAVRGLVEALDARWRSGAGSDDAARRLAERLGASGFPPAPERLSGDDPARRAWRLRAAAALTVARPADAGDFYVHVSHIRLDRPKPFAALRRAGARLAVMVHDLIPIRFPEYGRPGEAERHRVRMTTALDAATTLIANSEDTARDLAAFAAETGRAPRAILAAPLGLEPGFAADAPALAAATPYFVTLGTVEPRKNHLLLLHVWRRLAERLGDATPRLVVVGRRGWENEMVVDLLERSPAIRRLVVETNDLPDAALAALIKGARALLFPSFSEGYGLPLAEALALGSPVVASDLAVFREIAPGRLDLLDPLDGPGWEEVVLSLSDPASPRRKAALARMEGYAAPTWDAHFRIVRDVTGLA